MTREEAQALAERRTEETGRAHFAILTPTERWVVVDVSGVKVQA